MPVALVHLEQFDPDTRANAARAITEAIVGVCRVPAEKVQIMFLPSTIRKNTVMVHVVERGTAAFQEELTQRLRKWGADQVSVYGYPPEHTARGGELRRAGDDDPESAGEGSDQ